MNNKILKNNKHLKYLRSTLWTGFVVTLVCAVGHGIQAYFINMKIEALNSLGFLNSLGHNGEISRSPVEERIFLAIYFLMLCVIFAYSLWTLRKMTRENDPRAK